LYSLKQAPCVWQDELSRSFKHLGLAKSTADDSLYIHRSIPHCFLLVYVDDVLVVGEAAVVKILKQKLSQIYEMTDLGPASKFVGLEIARDRENRRLTVHQTSYTKKLLSRYGFGGSVRTTSTPMEPNLKLGEDNTPAKGPVDEPLSSDNVHWYQQLVGGLMYLMTSSRPDLAFTLSRLSKFFAAPRASHERAVLYVLRYLVGTTNYGITYGGSTTNRPYNGFTDADWAGDVDNRKSTGGYVFLLTGGAVSWRSKQQNSVARSTTEAEYIAASDAAAEVVWAHRLLKELDAHDGRLTKLFIDNESAMKLAKNAVC